MGAVTKSLCDKVAYDCRKTLVDSRHNSQLLHSACLDLSQPCLTFDLKGLLCILV